MAKTYYGYGPPFFGGQQNVLSRQSGDRLIKNDLLQLLLTNRGERVMRPNWGTLIGASLFDMLDDVTAGALETNIADAIIKYEPRVDVSVSVTHREDEHILYIKVEGIYTNEPNNTFELELNLPIPRTAEQ